MAILDKILNTASYRRMEELILEPGRPPRVARTGMEQPISSIPLDASMIARLVAEVAPGGQIPDPSSSPAAEFDYQVGEHTFRFSAVGCEGAWVARTTPPAVSPRAASLPIRAVGQLLRQVLDRNGSDLHLSPSQIPWMRLQGRLEPLYGYAPLYAEELAQLLYHLTPERHRIELERKGDTSFSLDFSGEARFRVNLFKGRAGVGAVFHLVRSQVPSAENLELPESVRNVAGLPSGLVLVTGPSGSGRSTTLAALIDLVNRSRSGHILTIENPVEIVHTAQRCLIHHREVGEHTGSFPRALRSALHEDPDLVMLSEIPDLETLSLAIEMAEAGRLVFGALNTVTAASTVECLIARHPLELQAQVRQRLAGCLRAVVCQALLKRVGGGRIAAFEVLACTPEISARIRSGRVGELPSLMREGRHLGMALLNDALVQLVEDGKVEPLEACLRTADRDDLVARLRDILSKSGCPSGYVS